MQRRSEVFIILFLSKVLFNPGWSSELTRKKQSKLFIDIHVYSENYKSSQFHIELWAGAHEPGPNKVFKSRSIYSTFIMSFGHRKYLPVA
jgi:hypothetical protein